MLLLMLSSSAWELCKLVVAFAVLAIPVAAVMPHLMCKNDRFQVAEVLIGTAVQRTEIAERILQRGSVTGVGQALAFTPSGQATAGLIRDDGTMLIVLADPPAALVLVPSIEAGEVTWACKGVPERTVPHGCRRPGP